MASYAETAPLTLRRVWPSARRIHRPGRASVVRRVWVLYSALTVAAIAGYYALPRAGIGQGILLTTVNATASVVAVRAGLRTSGSTRLVWMALGASMAFASLANGPYYAYPLITGSPVPFPCPVDILWLLTYPCFVVALLAFGRERRRGERRGDILDAALLTVAGGAAMWVFVIDPVIQAPGQTILAHIVAAAYPSMDLLVFAVLVRYIFTGLHRTGASRLLLGSFVALLVADLVYAVQLQGGTYSPGGPTDGLWMASYALIGIAATHPTARDLRRSHSRIGVSVTKARLTFLCLAVLAGPLLLVLDSDEVRLLAATSTASFLLVMARLTGFNWRLASLTNALERQVTTDHLTGLKNRSAFSGALGDALASSDAGVAILLIDLDDFKQVNDLAGHSAGDAVLVEVARRMRGIVRAEDLVARLGGDEFAILVRGVTHAERLGERLVEALGPRFRIGRRLFRVGASVGIATAVADSDPERLIQNADIAMYSAKSRGKNCIVSFEDSMFDDVVTRSDLADALACAIDRDELHLEYQPIVQLDDGEVVGFEALLRWTHPRFGQVPPSSFIAVAEESGSIVRIGSWVLETALCDLRELQSARGVPLTMNVNVSVAQLVEAGFAAEVADTLARVGVAADCLVLEVTEGAFVAEQSDAWRQLQELRAVGVRVSVDDFGTGYSSLAYLQRLPLEELKIDRLFVSGIADGRAEGSVARAIVGMCDALNLRCIAEGVESEDQVAPLIAAGCHFGQGFLFGRPAPIDRLIKVLQRS
jgi:diguanylate cyclase